MINENIRVDKYRNDIQMMVQFEKITIDFLHNHIAISGGI